MSIPRGRTYGFFPPSHQKEIMIILKQKYFQNGWTSWKWSPENCFLNFSVTNEKILHTVYSSVNYLPIDHKIGQKRMKKLLNLKFTEKISLHMYIVACKLWLVLKLCTVYVCVVFSLRNKCKIYWISIMFGNYWGSLKFDIDTDPELSIVTVTVMLIWN